MILEEPHRTTRNFRALLEKVGTEIFAADHRLEPYYLSASALYRLEYLFRTGDVDARLKPARYHLLLTARLLASGQRPPRPHSKEMARYADGLSPMFWDPVSARALLHGAVAIVEAAAAGHFHRDNIRTQGFTEEVIRRCREQVSAV